MRIGKRMGLALCLAGVIAAPAFALDGCPRGEFTLEGGCVLCLPGYVPKKTGSTNPQGQACYACKPSSAFAGDAVPAEPICREPSGEAAFGGAPQR